jgi:hypothetical protein
VTSSRTDKRGKQLAHFYLIEENNTWQGDNPAKELLEKLEINPFVRFEEMELNYQPKKQPYNRGKALSILKKGKEASVELSSSEPYKVRATITRGDWRNSVMLAFPNKHLRELDLNELRNYIADTAPLFPKFTMASSQLDSKIQEFYFSHKLRSVPSSFGDYVGWYSLISPTGYAPYFTREEILAVPSHSARELDNGNIEIIAYADPLSYDQPEVRERIILITEYLNAHRHDWQKQSSLVG